MSRKSGIYKIENLINNMVYIGSAIDLQSRFNLHRHDLRHNKHDNTHLQRAWNLYGEENFVFEILEYVGLDVELLFSREEFHEKQYPKNKKYNQREVVKSNLGMKYGPAPKESVQKRADAIRGIPLSEEHKRKISKALSGKRTQKPSVMRKPICQIDPETNEIIRNFDSMLEASVITGIQHANISAVCRGIRGLAGGFIWKFI